MIDEYFYSIIWLLEIVTLITETLYNSKNFGIMDLVVPLGVDHFAWEIGYDFLLCLCFWYKIQGTSEPEASVSSLIRRFASKWTRNADLVKVATNFL